MERPTLIGGTTLVGQARTTPLPDPSTLLVRLAAQVIADDLLVRELTRRLRERVAEQELRRAS